MNQPPETTLIQLTQGYRALIDTHDAERVLAEGKWYVRASKGMVYARRNTPAVTPGGNQGTTCLHNFLTGEKFIDHINGDGLDNRRSNLRIATSSQNAHNRRMNADNRSGYAGVHWDTRDRVWTAGIRLNGKLIRVGRFHDPVKAAHAVDVAKREHHGNFAVFNFPTPQEAAMRKSFQHLTHPADMAH